MRIAFGAVESPGFLRRLQALDVQELAINISRLRRKSWRPIDVVPDATLLVASIDLTAAPADLDRWLAQAEGDERVLPVYPPGAEFDHPRGVPTWDGEQVPHLIKLCRRYDRVAVGRDVLKDEAHTARLVSVARKHDTALVGFTGSPVEAEEAHLDILVNTVWVNSFRYGVTHVWDGRKLHNYPSDDKVACRLRHRADIERLGVLWEGVRDDEEEAVVALSIASWRAWAEAQDRSVATTHPHHPSAQVVLLPGAAIATEPVEPRQRETVPLPVVGTRFLASPGVEDAGEATYPVLRSNPTNVRQCDTCALAGRCPKYEEHASCAFEAPVSFENVSQVLGVAQFGLELHVQRLMFAMFAEQVEGEVLNPRVSAEIDRLYAILGKLKDLSDNSDELTIRMKTKAGAGRVAALFGSEAATRAAKLPGGGLDPGGSDRLLGEIFDAMGEPQDVD